MEKSLISTLKSKKDELTARLAKALTEKEFDLLDSELRQTTKTLILAENQERQRQEAESKAKRKAALEGFEKKRKEIKDVLTQADQQDRELFAKMEDLYYQFLDVYDQRQMAAAETLSLRLTASELEVEPPESIVIEMCGTRPATPGAPEDHLLEFVNQYSLAARALKDAKKNKVAGAPARPGMDWFNKGHGEFYPRDPEPDPKEVFAAIMKEKWAENAKAKKAKAGIA